MPETAASWFNAIDECLTSEPSEVWVIQSRSLVAALLGMTSDSARLPATDTSPAAPTASPQQCLTSREETDAHDAAHEGGA